MRLFLDTANLEQIKDYIDCGAVSGVTTNPSIIARENKPLSECIKDIQALDENLTILVEAVSKKAEDMVKEAREYVTYANDIVIKLPMTQQGLKATKILRAEGIKVCVTLVFSTNQAIAAGCAGANFVAPFVGRLDDIDSDGIKLVSDIASIFKAQGAKTEVLAASIRSPKTVHDLFANGCNIVTMPASIFGSMLKHPLTDAGLKRFDEDWKKVPKK